MCSKKINILAFALFLFAACVSIMMKLPAFKYDNDLAMSLSTSLPKDKTSKFYLGFLDNFDKTVQPGCQKELYKTYITSSIYMNYPIQAFCLSLFKFYSEKNFIKQIWDLIDIISYVSFFSFILASILFIQNPAYQKSCLTFFLICVCISLKNNKNDPFFLNTSEILHIILICLISLQAFKIHEKIFRNSAKKFLEKNKIIIFAGFTAILNYFVIKNSLIYLQLILVLLFYYQTLKIPFSLITGTAITLCFNQWLLWMSFIPVGRGFLFLLATFLVPMAIFTNKPIYIFCLPILFVFHMHVGLLVCLSVAFYECLRSRLVSLLNIVCLISSFCIAIFLKTFHFGWLPLDLFIASKAFIKIFASNNNFFLTCLSLVIFFLVGKKYLEEKNYFFLVYCTTIGCFLVSLEAALQKLGIDRYTPGLGKLTLIPLYLCPFLFSAALIYAIIKNQNHKTQKNTKNLNTIIFNFVIILAVLLFCQNPYRITKQKLNLNFLEDFNNRNTNLNAAKIYFRQNACATDPNIWYNFLKYQINTNILKNKNYDFEIIQ